MDWQGIEQTGKLSIMVALLNVDGAYFKLELETRKTAVTRICSCRA
jgi:hypothetical protein